MSKKFNKLKDPKLGLYDKLPIGKFINCRIIDIIETEWEYLIWLDKNTGIQFDEQVIATIQEYRMQDEEEIFYKEEIAPWLDEDLDDLPF